jgi:hypothetical protein
LPTWQRGDVRSACSTVAGMFPQVVANFLANALRVDDE